MEFNHDLLKKDFEAVREFFVKFLKSFGPSSSGKGFWEEQNIKFHMWLIDMGPVKIFKTIITVIVALVLYFTLFRHADRLFKIVTVFIFILFYTWIFGDELGKEAKDGKGGYDQYLVPIRKKWESLWEKKEEKKDAKKK